MTVAAGFTCQDGIVLCADSEYTWGSLLKTQGTKIARPPADDAVVLIAGAGAAPFMQGFFEDVRDGLPKTDKTVLVIKELIKRTLKELYRSYRAVPNWNDSESGGQFLIAVRGSDGQLALWETEGTRTNEVHECACVGIGLYLGYYVARCLYRQHITVKDASVAAAILIREVAQNVQHVGGDGLVVTLPAMGEPTNVDAESIAEYDEAFLAVSDALRPAVFACLNQYRPTSDLDTALETFGQKIMGVRAELSEKRIERGGPGKFSIKEMLTGKK